MKSIILGAFGPTEIILVLAVVVIFFGGKKIPQLMKGIGQGIREFKQAKDGVESEKTATDKQITQ